MTASFDAIAADAERLLGTECTDVAPGAAGKNNRIFKLATRGGRFALKQYPGNPDSAAERLTREWRSLSFLSGHGVDCIPRPAAVDATKAVAIYEWIEGTAIDAATAADIDAAANFLGRLDALRTVADAANLLPAMEACLSAGELTRQVESRFARLREVAAEQDDLRDFLEGSALNLLEGAYAGLDAAYGRLGIPLSSEIEPELRTLSPSDFGFHNALRRPDGGIVFCDFEYFGWDDPVKVIADFILHPGMQLDAGLAAHFKKRMVDIYGRDRTLEARLNALFPLYVFRWCAIVLNEFLPEKWARRAAAAGPAIAADREKILKTQLVKAKRLLANVN